jgi:hypothetical protein
LVWFVIQIQTQYRYRYLPTNMSIEPTFYVNFKPLIIKIG